MACIKLEEYQTAKTAFENGASLAPGDARFTKLIKECDQRIAGYLISFIFIFSVFFNVLYDAFVFFFTISLMACVFAYIK